MFKSTLLSYHHHSGRSVHMTNDLAIFVFKCLIDIICIQVEHESYTKQRLEFHEKCSKYRKPQKNTYVSNFRGINFTWENFGLAVTNYKILYEKICQKTPYFKSFIVRCGLLSWTYPRETLNKGVWGSNFFVSKLINPKIN